MPDPGDIVDRIRSYGARAVMENGKLRVLNPQKLPPEAAEFVRKHARAIYAYLLSVEQDEYEERAAILQYDGGLPRAAAEVGAWQMVRALPPGLSEAERDKRIAVIGRIIDEAIAPAWGVAA